MEIAFKKRQDWRLWLIKNHDKTEEIWLIFHKKHTGVPSITYDDAVEEALCFGWIDSLKKKVDENRYKQKFTPRRKNSKWSEINKRRVEKLIPQDLMATAGLKAVHQAKLDGNWDLIPTSRQTIIMPEELEEALAQNKRALLFFESLAPSYKKHFAGWVDTAKKPETRQRRIKECIELLEKGEKLGMR
ncbi:YdeI/OmpD-associated family protein [bacterium]|nr:YdeI/OmpD-associated family protein [bacterium]